MKKSGRIATLALLLLASVALAGSPASARAGSVDPTAPAALPTGFTRLAAAAANVTILNGGSFRCLDADASSLNRNGTKVTLWDCTSNALNQQWYWALDGNNSLYLVNTASSRCLDVDTTTGPNNGAKVQLWDCTVGSKNQIWLRTFHSNSYYVMINAAYRRCLDADNSGINSNGTKVQLWDCTYFSDGSGYAYNQRWYF
ncbi:RICIN domain-containing protein [Micromonospora vinacea]|uniref:RICIN domain-containing protein n=1 Tax=Micromonospora vinacea TaxID=709878 RepID=UPI003D929B50